MTLPPNNDEQPDYLAEIADISKLVESGKELVAQGNAIDLSNLEAIIGDLCQRMAATPPANPAEVTGAIEKVVADLTQLGEALRHQSEPKH